MPARMLKMTSARHHSPMRPSRLIRRSWCTKDNLLTSLKHLQLLEQGLELRPQRGDSLRVEAVGAVVKAELEVERIASFAAGHLQIEGNGRKRQHRLLRLPIPGAHPGERQA